MRTFFEVRLKKCGRVALLWMAVLAFSLPSAFADFKVGLVLDRGGKDDKSFNASAYEGAMKAKK